MAICVIGLGYVGLPLALSFASRNHKVIGVDKNFNLVDELNNGRSDIIEKKDNLTLAKILKRQLKQGNFKAVSDYAKVFKDCNKYIITVGIPIKDGHPDYSFLDMACHSLATGLKQNDLVIIRSTVPPGTTRERIKPKLEESGLEAGKDFQLAYVPERISEGNAFQEITNMPTIISGLNDKSAQEAEKLMQHICQAELIRVSTLETAELIKVIENIQRDVNIAQVQIYAQICQKLNIDTFELIKAANTHSRVNLLYPGPGVGGYCIPNALYYLLPTTKKIGVSTELLQNARQINDLAPFTIIEKVKKNIKPGSKISVLGLGMKDYSNDLRKSPSLKIIDLLIDEGYQIQAFDPVIEKKYIYQVESLETCLKKQEGILILCKQAGLTSKTILTQLKKNNQNPVIIDTRNLINQKQASDYGINLITI